MRYIDEMGMRHAMELALATIDANTHLHVSFDVDFLDPEIAPGVGTTVPGGPTYREAQLCMEMIADTGALASLDVMELNPALRRAQQDRRTGGGPDRKPVRQEYPDARAGRSLMAPTETQMLDPSEHRGSGFAGPLVLPPRGGGGR